MSALKSSAAAFFLFLAAHLAPGAGAATKPNILLIVSDDQGWPDLGCIGLKKIVTPTATT